MDTPVHHSQPRDTRKCLFTSPTDTTHETGLPGYVTPTPLGTSQKRNRRKIFFSPQKSIPLKKKTRQSIWTQKEFRSLVEFVALHKDLQSSEHEWPVMNADNTYWTKASEFIKQTCGSVRSTISCRAKVVNHFRQTYSTIAEAQEEFAIDYEDTSALDDSGFHNVTRTPATPATSYSVDNFVEYYLSKFSQEHLISIWMKLSKEIPMDKFSQSVKSILNDNQMVQILNTTSVDHAKQLVTANFTRLSLENKKQCLDKLFQSVAEEGGLKNGTDKFTSLSISAMKTLRDNMKPNLVKDFVKCIGSTRPNSQEPPMPVNRMPFGLIQHQIQFVCASDIRQISIPDDYFQWLESLDAEFEDRLGRILRGPVCSGQPSDCIGNPLKVYSQFFK